MREPTVVVALRGGEEEEADHAYPRTRGGMLVQKGVNEHQEAQEQEGDRLEQSLREGEGGHERRKLRYQTCRDKYQEEESHLLIADVPEGARDSGHDWYLKEG